MAKLFLSYARQDHAIVEKLAAALEAAGHDVWWDKHIKAGSVYEHDIEAALKDADAAIVAWSGDAVQSAWVKDEAAFARDAGKLVPISLDGAEAPLGFRQYQTMGFKGWKGDSNAAAFQALQTAIAEKSGDAPPTDTPSEPSPAIKLPVAAAAGVGALVIAIAAFFLFQPRGGAPDQQNAAIQPTDDVSIAVLPFADMSPEGNQEYFADGLSEELLNVLVRIDGLKVASRTSSFSMRDKNMNIGEIAQALNVNHIVEGSIRKSNNRIRVTAQLIDTHTDKHLWSETYDRQLSDIFRIQDEIANSIFNALRSELGVEKDTPIKIKPATENLTAYELYLKARELFTARGKANVKDSLDLFEQITQMQPDYAEAWEGLAGVYAVASSWGITDRDYSALSLDAARKALEIDPSLSMPYAVIGLTYRTHYPTPWEESLDNLKKAVANDPSNMNAHLWMGMNYMGLGYHDRAMAAFDACLDIDPAFNLCRKYKSIVHLFRGETDEAMALAEKNAESGYFNDFDVYIPVVLAQDDRLTAFTISRFINWWAKFPHPDYIDALENPDALTPQRFEALEVWASERKVDLLDKTNIILAYRAYDRISVEGFDNDYEDLWLPAFGHFRQSPEFKSLTAALGLTDYWRANGFPAQCEIISETDFVCQ
ncbi:MAG: TIR domain-containing protein [Pseudomonadota bacterium]